MNVLNSPKISYLTKKKVFQFNLPQIEENLEQKC